MRKLWQATLTALLIIISTLFMPTTSLGGHGYPLLHNATEQNTGNWWGSSAEINYTNPNLNGGSWSYHRTAVGWYDPYWYWSFVENGWIKDSSSGLYGLGVWQSSTDCMRREVRYGISPATHRYQQRYFNSGGQNWYALEHDFAWVASVETGFSYGTMVIAGGETQGIESMAWTDNIRNWKLYRDGVGNFYWINWDSHINYIDNPPYFNVNNSIDPGNEFYSVGN